MTVFPREVNWDIWKNEAASQISCKAIGDKDDDCDTGKRKWQIWEHTLILGVSQKF